MSRGIVEHVCADGFDARKQGQRQQHGEGQGQDQSAEPSAAPAGDVKAQGVPAQVDLAQTGGSPVTPYLAGGAVALVLAGRGAVAVSRRRRRA